MEITTMGFDVLTLRFIVLVIMLLSSIICFLISVQTIYRAYNVFWITRRIQNLTIQRYFIGKQIKYALITTIISLIVSTGTCFYIYIYYL